MYSENSRRVTGVPPTGAPERSGNSGQVAASNFIFSTKLQKRRQPSHPNVAFNETIVPKYAIRVGFNEYIIIVPGTASE